jgi:UPF0716 protein FxsA
VRVFPLLFFLFLTVPLLEIYLLIKLGGVIGAGPTILLVIGTALAGAWLLRQQGLATLMRAQGAVDRGEVPALELLEGLVLLVGGVLLLTPGLLTDALGLVCLLPWTRQAAIRALAARALVMVRERHPQRRPGRRTFDGEYREVDDPPPADRDRLDPP